MLGQRGEDRVVVEHGRLIRLASGAPARGEIYIDKFARGLSCSYGRGTPFLPSDLVAASRRRGCGCLGPTRIKTAREQERRADPTG